MSKIATIKRAIDELEGLRDGASPAPWSRTYGMIRDANEEDALYSLGGEENVQLALVLHRTVEPQLSLLRLAVKYGELDAGSGSSFITTAHDLALSILEETNE